MPRAKPCKNSCCAQRDAGTLLALCSKNNEADVRAVFASHPEMPLKPEHFFRVARQLDLEIGKPPVPGQGMNIGADSIVLIDDNPMECAEAEAGCPQVNTLQLPEDQNESRNFSNTAGFLTSYRSRTKTAVERKCMSRTSAAKSSARSLSVSPIFWPAGSQKFPSNRCLLRSCHAWRS